MKYKSTWLPERQVAGLSHHSLFGVRHSSVLGKHSKGWYNNFYSTWRRCVQCGKGWVLTMGTPALCKSKPSQWIDHGWQPNAHPATVLLPPTAGQGEKRRRKSSWVEMLSLAAEECKTLQPPPTNPDLLLTGAGSCRWVKVRPVVAIAACADRRGFGGGAAVGGARHTDPCTLAGLEGPCWTGCKRKERKAVGC